LHDYSSGTGCHRIVDKVPAVPCNARAGKKHITRLDLTRIQTQLRLFRNLAFQPLDDILHPHRAVSPLGPIATIDSIGASGWMPRRRRLLPTTPANTGAATRPP